MTFHTPIREEGGLVRMFCGHQSGCSPNIEVQFISASMENVIEPWIMVSSLSIHGTTKSPGTYLQKKGLTTWMSILLCHCTSHPRWFFLYSLGWIHFLANFYTTPKYS